LNELAGVLVDYNNGRWEELHRWKDRSTRIDGMQIVENLRNGRDAIYVIMLVTRKEEGLFIVLTSRRESYKRAFAPTIYDIDEAFKDVAVYCRRKADEMGFRRLEQ